MYVLGVNPITSAKWDSSKEIPSSADASGRASDEERGLSVDRRSSVKTSETIDV